jgi:uncharacterized protein (DUF983 family)
MSDRDYFQLGYNWKRPALWGEWLVMSNIMVVRGIKSAHIGLSWYLNSFYDED